MRKLTVLGGKKRCEGEQRYSRRMKGFRYGAKASFGVDDLGIFLPWTLHEMRAHFWCHKGPSTVRIPTEQAGSESLVSQHDRH